MDRSDMGDSKAQEAAREEQWVEVAPPAYDEAASVASEEDLYYATPQRTGLIEGASTLPDSKDMPDSVSTSANTATHSKAHEMGDAAVWYKQAALSEAPSLPTKESLQAFPVTTSKPDEQPPALPVWPSFDDERLALQLQQEEYERAAKPPIGQHFRTSADGTNDLFYNFSWRRPFTDHPTLAIAGLDTATDTSHWRLEYQSKYFARLHRYQANQARVDGDFPARQVAEIKYPEFILPGCGPSITFEPHEDAIYRKGSAHAQRESKFMKCSGWLTTRYTLELPALGGARCTWHPVQSSNKDWQPELVVNGEPQRTTTGEMLVQAKRYMNDDTWTPYPTQQLIVDNSGMVIAAYGRAAPWARDASVLHIIRPEGIQNFDEYVEGIIIATVAMVGMQDRMGLASSLMQASTESVMASRKIQQDRAQAMPPSGETTGMKSVLTDDSSLQRQSSPLHMAATKSVDFAQSNSMLDAEGYKENTIQRSLRRLSDHLAAKSEALLPQNRGQRVMLGEKI